MDHATDSFKEKLDTTYSFPALYMFKFIVRPDQVGQIEKQFSEHEVILKPSSGGKYVSTTIKIMASSSDEIIEHYKEAAKIEGIISL
ncbi:DUF493 domain-containing protein [Reichenbachiella carrageenanivorans]|uniref:DUF493 domain-containing protein n=1 Tax=Reichenbachiella carrageenanivorans TaxID=2979869 RepID=A0ABY6D2X6_9BACT|nr:DUF493 domain-containing protein [Reichenbachiella carrageenanivorans]UXX80512.1 DUF493 domain-containing protein [Reichenbachiella carrageenanivorans]